MPTTINAKLNRNDIAVLRSLAIRSIKAACPRVTARAIAQALSVDRGLVNYYVQGRGKQANLELTQSWQPLLMNASAAASRGDFSLASRLYSEVSAALLRVHESMVKNETKSAA